MGMVPRFRLSYIADGATKFAPARRQFERLSAGAASGSAPVQPDTLLRYFEFLKRERQRTTRSRGDQFEEPAKPRRPYGGLEYDALFEKWQAASFSAFPPVVPMKTPLSMAPKFEPTLLGRDYRFLGEAKTGRDGESHPRSTALSLARSPKPGAQAYAAQGVAATTQRGTGQPPQQATIRPHAVSDPVVTGFGPTGQSSAGSVFTEPLVAHGMGPDSIRFWYKVWRELDTNLHADLHAVLHRIAHRRERGGRTSTMTTVVRRRMRRRERERHLGREHWRRAGDGAVRNAFAIHLLTAVPSKSWLDSLERAVTAAWAGSGREVDASSTIGRTVKPTVASE